MGYATLCFLQLTQSNGQMVVGVRAEVPKCLPRSYRGSDAHRHAFIEVEIRLKTHSKHDSARASSVYVRRCSAEFRHFDVRPIVCARSFD